MDFLFLLILSSLCVSNLLLGYFPFCLPLFFYFPPPPPFPLFSFSILLSHPSSAYSLSNFSVPPPIRLLLPVTGARLIEELMSHVNTINPAKQEQRKRALSNNVQQRSIALTDCALIALCLIFVIFFRVFLSSSASFFPPLTHFVLSSYSSPRLLLFFFFFFFFFFFLSLCFTSWFLLLLLLLGQLFFFFLPTIIIFTIIIIFFYRRVACDRASASASFFFFFFFFFLFFLFFLPLQHLTVSSSSRATFSSFRAFLHLSPAPSSSSPLSPSSSASLPGTASLV